MAANIIGCEAPLGTFNCGWQGLSTPRWRAPVEMTVGVADAPLQEDKGGRNDGGRG